MPNPSERPQRVVTDTMLGLSMAEIDRWSDRVTVVLGLNPGPFTGPGTNTYVVGTGRRRLLLDTGEAGRDDYLDTLDRALADHCDGASIDRIVVTHGHPDHVGGVHGVLDRHGAIPVSKMPWPEMDRDLEIDCLADGDEVVTEGATLRGVWTPGHAPDHLCFYLVEEKAVFTGDVVLGAGTTVIPPNGDLGQYLDSLRRLLELDMEVIYPAHGPAIREPHTKVEQYIAHRLLRDEQILDGLGAGIERVGDLVRRIYVDIPTFLHDAAAISVGAHLRKLESERRVHRAPDADRWFLS